jgi:nicotinate phosphoribosyltransferase
MINKQIITKFTDNDLYSFSVCLVYLNKFPRAYGHYTFFDRDNTIYPEGFADKVIEQIETMRNVVFTDEEETFMKKKCYYFPHWFYTFLKGYRFNPDEVYVYQDEEGHLKIEIEGLLWRTIWWEVPLLAIISELKHIENGDMEKYNYFDEYVDSYERAKKMLENGIYWSEFGMRRRFSAKHEDMITRSFVDAVKDWGDTTTGKFVGSSTVSLAMKYNLTPMGTMSHQFISAIGGIYGVQEANYKAMELWSDVYMSDLGIFLFDTYGWNAFARNFTKLHAKLFDGLRVDSGDNLEMFNKIYHKYVSLGIDPKNKSVVFSNGLSVDDAIKIHKAIDGSMHDTYGIGTQLTCNVRNVKPSNMVIKLTGVAITEKREWNKCVKLSCDYGKYTGDKDEIEFTKYKLGIK